MLSIRDARDVGVGLLQKIAGIGLEAAGSIVGSTHLKEQGRARQEAGTERLAAVEEETKATARSAEAQMQEDRQRRYQPADKRSNDRSVDTQASATLGGVEKVKGVAKQAVGTFTGNDDLAAEGEAQSDKAEAQVQAAKHETKADVHRARAGQAERRAESVSR